MDSLGLISLLEILSISSLMVINGFINVASKDFRNYKAVFFNFWSLVQYGFNVFEWYSFIIAIYAYLFTRFNNMWNFYIIELFSVVDYGFNGFSKVFYLIVSNPTLTGFIIL